MNVTLDLSSSSRRSFACEHIRVSLKIAAYGMFLTICFGCDEFYGKTYGCAAILRYITVLKLGISIVVGTSR